MPDFTSRGEGLGAFGQPDETALKRGMADEGTDGDFDDIFHPEEVAGNGDFRGLKERTPSRGEKLDAPPKGGGETLQAILEHSAERVDPEALMLIREFLEEKYGVDTFAELNLLEVGSGGIGDQEELYAEFSAWEQKNDRTSVQTIRPEIKEDISRPTINLEIKSGSDLEGLENLWANPKTQIIYQYGTTFAEDSMTFTLPGDKTVSIPAFEFIENLHLTGVKKPKLAKATPGHRFDMHYEETESIRIVRPVEGHRMEFLEQIKSVELNGASLQAKTLEVVPKPLDLDLETRWISKPALAESATKWFDIWDRKDEDVVVLVTPIENDSTGFGIAIVSETGERASLPGGIFSRAVGGEKWAFGANGSTVKGMRLVDGTVIATDQSASNIERTMQRLRINGVQRPDIEVELS